MKRPRRNHTAAFKAKVALAALKGDRTPADLAEKYDVHGNQITQWKTQLLEGAIGVFMSPAEKRGTDQGPSAKEMQAKIGQLALEFDFLEVVLGRVGDASASGRRSGRRIARQGQARRHHQPLARRNCLTASGSVSVAGLLGTEPLS